jgi:hypothetical protein
VARRGKIAAENAWAGNERSAARRLRGGCDRQRGGREPQHGESFFERGRGSTSRRDPVSTLEPMGMFKRRDDPLVPIAAQLAELDRRLAAAQFENTDLQARLVALETKPLPPPFQTPDTDDLAAKVRMLLGDPPPAADLRRVEALEAARDRLELRLAELSTVVTNQLSELGGELDAAEHATASRLLEMERQLAELTEAVHSPSGRLDHPTENELAELRANQVRIANELARFSIAVREEMAVLAPRVRVGARP